MPRSVIWYALKLFIGSSISWDNIAGPYLEDEDHYSLIMSQLDLRCQSSLMAIGTLFDKILHTFNLLQSNFGFEFKFKFGCSLVHQVINWQRSVLHALSTGDSVTAMSSTLDSLRHTDESCKDETRAFYNLKFWF